MAATILIIDDDRKLNKRLGRYLRRFDLEVISTTLPGEGLDMIHREKPNLVILDVMLPEMDGFRALKKIRERGNIPVIMLTARGDVQDRVAGLELGADDYLPKPFEPRELLARIKTVLRRHNQVSVDKNHHIRKFGHLTINFGRGAVEVDGKLVNLTDLEFKILSLLVRNSGIAVDREKLLNHIRGMDWEAFNRSIDVLISRLRQKLGDNSRNPHYIKTVWGTGYMFIGEEK
jgi:DNA-binding response OmpR family regulator